MPTLSDRDRRTIRLGGILLLLYLGVFYGLKGWRLLEEKRGEHEALRLQAATLMAEVSREAVKARRLRTLRESTRIHLEGLREETLVGDARAAIQKAAQTAGVQLGVSKESPGAPSSLELAMIQLDGQGPAPALAPFVLGLRSLGYPIVIDRLQVLTAGLEPGQVRFTVNVAVMSFAAWKARSKTDA